MRLSRRPPLTAVLIVAALLTGCGAGSTASPPPAAKASATETGSLSAPPPARTAGSAVPQASAAPSPAALPVAPGAGSQPQTRAFPSTDSTAFRHAMTDLWLAVTSGKPSFGEPAGA